jgi:SulP family sulfate permease
MSLLVLVFALAPLVSLIPTAVLAGVLLGTSWRIANPRSIKEALQTTWPERISYLVTALAVVVIDLIIGTIIGIVVHYIATRFFTKGAQ